MRNLSRTAMALVAAATFVAGCGKDPEVDSAKVEAAKQRWQSARAPQDYDQLRNRLMTSQTDR